MHAVLLPTPVHPHCRYWVTWKADGTRYMLLLLKFGAYLIDRAGEVRP